MPPETLFFLKLKSALSHICYLNAAIIVSFFAGRLDTVDDVSAKQESAAEKKDVRDHLNDQPPL